VTLLCSEYSSCTIAVSKTENINTMCSQGHDIACIMWQLMSGEALHEKKILTSSSSGTHFVLPTPAAAIRLRSDSIPLRQGRTHFPKV